MQESLVSVIVPCYNMGTKIERLLNSLCQQTYKKLELIFINDGSTDNTNEVILSYREKFMNRGFLFRYVEQKNAGLGNTIARGLSLMRGDYFIWPDADDWLEPQSIEIRVAFLEDNPEYDIVSSDANVFCAPDFNTIKDTIARNSDAFRTEEYHFLSTLHFNTVFCPGCHMVRTAAYKRVNPNGFFFGGGNLGQNLQILLPLYYNCKRKYIDLPLYNYVIYDDSCSHRKYNYEQQKARLDGYDEIIIQTLSQMDISDEERKRYLTMVEDDTAKKKYNLAYAYLNRTDMKKYYAFLKINGSVQFKMSLLYYISMRTNMRNLYHSIKRIINNISSGKGEKNV